MKHHSNLFIIRGVVCHNGGGGHWNWRLHFRLYNPQSPQADQVTLQVEVTVQVNSILILIWTATLSFLDSDRMPVCNLSLEALGYGTGPPTLGQAQTGPSPAEFKLGSPNPLDACSVALERPAAEQSKVRFQLPMMIITVLATRAPLPCRQ